MNLYERHLRAALSIRGNGETPHRHLKPLANTDVDKHYRRKSLNIVPKYVKPLQDSNHKIETLKTHPGRFVCDSNDVKFIPSRIGEVQETLASNQKFKDLTGWTPKVSLINWLQND